MRTLIRYIQNIWDTREIKLNWREKYAPLEGKIRVYIETEIFSKEPVSGILIKCKLRCLV